MMKLRWSEEKTVKFVQLYRDHENLWNMFNPEYRNRETRNMSLQIIVDEMGDPTLTLKDVPRKIKALRSTYYLELAKMEKNKAKGEGTDYIYNTSLQWFNDMHFIMKSATGNKGNIDNMETVTQWPVEPTEVEPPADTKPQISSISGGVFDGAATEICEPILRPEQPSVRVLVTSSTGRKATLKRLARARNRVIRRRPFDAVAQEPRYSNDDDKPSPSRTAGHEDECEIMGKHIAIQLRELPVHDRLRANFEIQKILMDFRLRNISPKLLQSTPIISSNQEHSSICMNSL